MSAVKTGSRCWNRIGSLWRLMSPAPPTLARSSNPSATPQLHIRSGNSCLRPRVRSWCATSSPPGRKVFLDLKYHDIPNTVAAAVRSAGELGVAMLTVHASGGSKMLKSAAEAAAQSPAQPMVLAVTVLTSLSDDDLPEIGVSGTVLAQVLRLGTLARKAGCGGLVASAREARELRRELGEDFAIVTPGVRPAGSADGDQARVVTPRAAIAAGATHLVVGRPILESAYPPKAVADILADIEMAMD